MKTVNIAELKDHLSEYLRLVRRGQSILVCDRNRVVARIEPAGAAAVSDDEEAWLEELERRGTIRRAARSLGRKWLEQRPKVGADVVAALLEERDEGR